MFRIERDSSVDPPGLRLSLIASAEDERELRIPLTPEWGIGITSDLSLKGEFAALVEPPLSVRVLPAEGEASGEFRIFWNRNPDKRPFDVLGGLGLLSLTVNDTMLGIGLRSTWDIDAGEGSIDPLVFGKIDAAKLKLGSDDADGFISNIL